MKYFTFVGNHDKIAAPQINSGPLFTIFLQNSEQINQVFILVTPSRGSVDYTSIAQQNKKRIQAEKPDIKVEIVELKLENPVDFDLVYPTMLHETQKIIEQFKLQDAKKIINITSGTPTMTTCWVLLHSSGLIKNAQLVQAFETKHARRRGSSSQVVNLSIDDFPQITVPDEIKRQLTITSREKDLLSKQLTRTEEAARIPELVGNSNAMQDIKEQILYDVDVGVNVLITGERGCGKQVVANAIWKLYHRPGDNLLQTCDCGTIPKDLIASELFGYRKGAFTGADQNFAGRLSECDGRMIFLDEIGNMPLTGQKTLLRFLNDGEIPMLGTREVRRVNTQILAATNKDIHDETQFAQDLKDRFDEIIHIPPLRERKEDIAILANYFLSSYSRDASGGKPYVLEDALLQKLTEYDWPGNIRELEKWIKRITRRFSGGIIKLEDLPKRIITEIIQEDSAEDDIQLPDLPLPVTLSDYMEMIREKARLYSGGNMAEVDRLLKQSEGTEKQAQYRNRKKQ